MSVRRKSGKSSERSRAKKAAWKAFSTYIRTRDCIRFTGDPTQGKCVTCNRSYPFKQLQAGHFIQGRGNSVLFDDRLVYTQCVGCNGNPPMGKGGNYVEYFVFMEKEWGREAIDAFRELKNETIKYSVVELQELEQEFKNLTKELLDSMDK